MYCSRIDAATTGGDVRSYSGKMASKPTTRPPALPIWRIKSPIVAHDHGHCPTADRLRSSTSTMATPICVAIGSRGLIIWQRSNVLTRRISTQAGLIIRMPTAISNSTIIPIVNGPGISFFQNGPLPPVLRFGSSVRRREINDGRLSVCSVRDKVGGLSHRFSCPLASASGGSDLILLEPLPWCGSDSQPLPLAIVALYSVLVQHIAKFSQKSGRISADFDLICQSRLTTTVRRLGSPNTGTQGRHRLINAMLKAWRDRHAKARVRGRAFYCALCLSLLSLAGCESVSGLFGDTPATAVAQVAEKTDASQRPIFSIGDRYRFDNPEITWEVTAVHGERVYWRSAGGDEQVKAPIPCFRHSLGKVPGAEAANALSATAAGICFHSRLALGCHSARP